VAEDWACGAHLSGRLAMQLGRAAKFPPCTAFDGHVDKMVFGNALTHGRPTKVMWPVSHTMDRLSLCFVPRHFLVSYCL
jgi:hypothetical protein